MRQLARELADGESVVASFRPHWRSILPGLVLLPILVGISSFVIFSLADDGWGLVLRIVIAVAVLILLARLTVRPLLAWLRIDYALTPVRALVRRGNKVFSVHLADLREVRIHRSVLGRPFAVGTCEIITDSGSVFFSGVKYPQEVRQIVFEIAGQSAVADQPDPRRGTMNG